MAMQERLFTVNQVGDLLGATPAEVLGWVRKGWLDSQRLPDGPIRISERSLIRFLKGRGIDIMQLMVSTAVGGGKHAAGGAGANGGEAPRRPAGLPGPEEAPGPAGPTADELTEELAARDILTGPAAASDDGPGPIPSLDEMPRRPRPTDQGGAEPPPPADEDEPAPPGDDEDAAPPPGPDFAGLGDDGDDEGPFKPGLDELFERTVLADLPAAADGPPPPGDDEDAGRCVAADADDRAPDDIPPAAEQVAEAILEDAVVRGASHVHLAIGTEGPSLRLRVDGELRAKPGFARRLRPGLAPAVIEQLLRWACGGDADAARPRRGAFTRTVDGRDIGFDLSALPAGRAPRVVLAVRDTDVPPPSLGELQLPAAARERVERALSEPGGGLILVAGPPRQGRQAALAALAGALAEAGRDVVAIGLPHEPAVPGTLAAAVDPVHGYPVRMAAETLTDQDPDAAVISQLRDPVTAASAVEAALAGATVLAGLTATTPGRAVAALLEAGVEPWPLGEALRGVILCRRLRKLCDACKQTVRVPGGNLPDAIRAGDGDDEPAEATLARAVGCDRCGESGYAGAVPLTAAAMLSPDIARAVRRGAGAAALDAAFTAAGTPDVRTLAAAHLRARATSLEEVLGALSP